MVFIIAVYVYYGDIRLGAPGSKPEYNDLSWFTMLFACGVGVGKNLDPLYFTCCHVMLLRPVLLRCG